MATSSMSTPGELERPLAAELDRRRAGERVAVGDERVLVAVGAGVREDPAVLGARRGARAASTEQMMIAAPMSTSLFEFMYLRYGRPIEAVARADVVRISSAVLASRIHACRVVGGDGAEPGPQLADRDEVLVGDRGRRRRGSRSRTSGRSAPAGTRRARPRPGGSCRGRSPSITGGWSSGAFGQSQRGVSACGPASACATPRRR